ncbi:hypothetical protein ABIB87_003762 [Bradyrhizobium sp. JR18.2]
MRRHLAAVLLALGPRRVPWMASSTRSFMSAWCPIALNLWRQPWSGATVGSAISRLFHTQSGAVPPRIAVVRYFTSGGKPTQRTFATESLSTILRRGTPDGRVSGRLAGDGPLHLPRGLEQVAGIAISRPRAPSSRSSATVERHQWVGSRCQVPERGAGQRHPRRRRPRHRARTSSARRRRPRAARRWRRRAPARERPDRVWHIFEDRCARKSEIQGFDFKDSFSLDFESLRSNP